MYQYVHLQKLFLSLLCQTSLCASFHLNAYISPGWTEVTRIVRDVDEQNERRRGWVRVFPTEDTWSNYGYLFDFGSTNNLLLHEHLYPHNIVKPRTKTLSTPRRMQGQLIVNNTEEDKNDDRSATDRVAQYEKPLASSQMVVRKKSGKSSQIYQVNYSIV